MPIEDTDDEEWDYTFRAGASATLWGMQALFPSMKAEGGRIVNFASGSGKGGEYVTGMTIMLNGGQHMP